MTTPLNVDLKGKTALVTGATAGIGKEIARGLLHMGAHVILGVRNVEKGQAVAKELGGTSTVLKVDTSSPASIRTFATEVKSKFSSLNILINNAGAWYSDRRTSPEGKELTFATNVLGPFVLNEELLPLLEKGAPSRVVNVVSGLASDYDPADLEFTRRKFDGFKAYGASKLAARMITWGLAKRVEGKGIAVNAAAPGFVRTEFNKNARGFIATMINVSASLFADKPEQGADAILYVAVAPQLEGQSGKFFDRRKEKDGKYYEPAPIAELEQKLRDMARA
jgi:NAD(P)-dependent dehydrogenase (short-subunit alcohol dehydrogenase family)